MQRTIVHFMAWAAAIAGLGSVAAAAPKAATERVEVRLLSEWRSLPPDGGTFSVALEQKIIPGWHTYWRNPGDSGQPTSIAWSLPDGFKAGDIEWPAPKRIPFQTLVNFGYESRVLFPVTMTAAGGLVSGRQVTLSAEVYWLVCEKICIPEEATLTLTLPVRDAPVQRDEAAADAIAAARARLPRPGGWTARFDGEAEHLRIAIAAPELIPAFRANRVTDVAFFPYRDDVLFNAAPQSARVTNGELVLDLKPGFGFTQAGMEPPDQVKGVLVLSEKIDDGETIRTAFELAADPGEVAAPAVPWGSATPAAPLVQALLFALLGGLILNLMPCVFPVIFLKALSIVTMAREAPARLRAHGMLYAAGVVLSFTALGGLMFALRAGGDEIGWGFQLQSPVVVAGLTYVMFAVGLSLSGVYLVGTSLQGVGGSLAELRGAGGAFFTGVLAVVVAAPCTAPFMAVALFSALVVPPATGLAVFVALGLGMALPYLAMSFSPALAARLPQPGAWMERLKQFLAFPLYLTGVWLIWVLAQQNVGAAGVGVVLTGLVLIAFAGWLAHMRTGLASASWRTVTAVLALLSLAAALGGLALLKAEPPSPAAAASIGPVSQGKGPAVPYEDFSQALLDERLEGERPVFLNFTAAWCITCHWNDANALSAQAVVDKFKALNVAYLRGDWTNRNPEITRILERFGRAGVPLYVYYGPPVDGARPAPKVLPPLLSEGIVLDALARR